ncbi:MAG: hypothetical protein J6N45_01685 [Alphaproteobacteria bacterium]|nr:hypothetical protein [Alphaproteobacteria bacterium]
MKDNPYAKVFREAFMHDVLGNVLYTPSHPNKHPDRVEKFMDELNKFLHTAGQPKIPYKDYSIKEEQLINYALFMRCYMRDSQEVLANLQPKYATDPDLIDLFQAASNYLVSGSHSLNQKKIFDNNVSYRTWKIDLSEGFERATYQKASENIDPSRHSLYLFMPFRVKDDEKQLKTWTYNNMRQTLCNTEIFGPQVDAYVINFPIQKSRTSTVVSLLKTLQNSEDYYEDKDMEFVKKHWLKYVGKDLKIDDKGKVISGEPYSTEQLKQNFNNITIFSYCAGTANAHRSLIALSDITRQLYDEKTTTEAMHNVFVCSYGFLPPRDHLPYSGVHFYTNAVPDTNRREPFANLNNHSLYEKTKCRTSADRARYTQMPDGRNFVVALQMPKKLTIMQDGEWQPVFDMEFGHNLANVNTPNIQDIDNFAHNLFKTVIEKSSMGTRGAELLSMPDTATNNAKIINIALHTRMQKLKE